ncbi:sodium-dependent transporter bedraggled isoform X2 [Diachasmimorpha longicaudata]|uniref:sodium-dependent transporter bedraggled isoform X2 n=1 Tax=Diachasmimorpha longicaudata TaxID=58733 RepID=UPI0030B8D275
MSVVLRRIWQSAHNFVVNLNRKMANVPDDEDLIDLEGGVNVSRASIHDATADEQEHLLDVCPPKLEQKLSLTREHKLVREYCDNGDILVTLGHDQVVPTRKRIDVVSSETIKRVRDITKNLEPVMNSDSGGLEGDQLDSPNSFLPGEEADDAMVEAQVISAFDFLAELDDNEEDIEGGTKEVNDEEFGSERRRLNPYPLEPTCFIKNPNGSFHDVDVCNKELDCSEERPVVEDRGLDFSTEFDNLGYDVSPPSKKPRFDFSGTDRPKSVNFGGDEESGRRKIQRMERKSWSAGGREEDDCLFERSNSWRDNYSCQPSTSGIASSSNCRTQKPSASSSECSEVDWSWVEELEHYRSHPSSKSSSSHLPPPSPTPSSTDPPCNLIPGVNHQTVEPTSEENVCLEGQQSLVRMRSPSDYSPLPNGSVAMSVETTAKSSPASAANPPRDDTSMTTITTTIDDESSHHDDYDSSIGRNIQNSPANSWVRASMRRLRHLRLPEADRARRPPPQSINNDSTIESSVVISAPNSLPDIALIAPEILAAQTNGSAGGVLRPSSAPVVRNSAPGAVTPRRGRRNTRSRDSISGEGNRRQSASGASSRDVSINSGSASASVSPISRSPQHQNSTSSGRRTCERQRQSDRETERSDEEDEEENPLGKWPHALSPALACLGCTLGLFNISRFAILSVQFGANFIVQFLVLSLVLGIPLLTLQVCLGQRLAAGAVDMWRISPIFHGVGIALLIAHAFIGIYSIIGISWMFVYFRDSFITKQDRYRWAEPFDLYREDAKPVNTSVPFKLQETVPDYFSGVVLQRHHLNEPNPSVVTLKFQVAFNLAVVWMIVFVSLSKGLRSYGKVVYVFTLVPVFGTLVLCTKLLGLTPAGTIHQLFPATVWNEFFINNRSWVAASSEVFLTWGLLGAAAMQIAAHNKHKHLLQRDTSLVIVLTLVVLLLSAFLANTCVQILRYHGYIYTTSTFERISGYIFMRPVNQPAPSGYGNTPERFMSHASFLLGQRAIRPGADLSLESGYQALRLSTELVPATLAVLGTEQVSPFWAVLFYFILILFGIAQQLAIWHCVITGIMAINTKMMKLWETTITFFSCACAYILGLPMATEFGIYVVYYLDYTVGGAWWIMVLYLVQVGAVFAVRGRPHTGEAVVAELFPPTGRCLRHWAGPLLSFTWNVILPVTLMVLSITLFKSSSFRDLYSYRRTNRDYWAVWARQLGAAIQLIPILIIPAVAIIQTCRYLNSGPPDIFDRIQLLYRPSLEPHQLRRHPQTYSSDPGSSIHANGVLPTPSDLPFEDPPPKYTPPPSYTTATGARIAKMLRQSFRRSVRRIANVLGEGSAPRTRAALQPPPPDYATVLVEMNQTILPQDVTVHAIEPRPDVTDTGPQQVNHERHRPNTIDRMTRISSLERCPVARTHSTIERNRRLQSGSSNLTAADVANLLRSSIRRGTNRTSQPLRRNSVSNPPVASASVENLVNAAAPIGQDSLVSDKDTPLVHEMSHDDGDEKTGGTDSTVSVI